MLARNSRRFATFVGEDVAWEVGPEGSDPAKYRASLAVCQSLY
jgi:hypothetical protein